jgi:large subunit ribosomal protein L4
MSTKLETTVYSTEGKEVSKLTLPERVFGTAWNADLVHEVVTSIRENARAGTAHTKDRSEVRGGGKKPWKQKGTGRARHGSSRSPIWSGGGVAHGPRNERSYSRKVNKNARAKALACVLSQKFADGEVVFVNDLTMSEPKAKDARKILVALGGIKGVERIATKRTNAALIILGGREQNTELSFRNFGNIAVVQAKDVNPVELLTYKYVVVAKPEASVKALESRVETKTAKALKKAGKVTTTKA